jgi:hypothetical protein
MLTFKICNNDLGLPDEICPSDKRHGHLWDGVGREMPISLFPILANKTIALQILFELSDLVLTGGALGSDQNIDRVKQQIAESDLPEDG